MPGVDGLELVRTYRRTPDTANIPIIVLSTKEEASVKSRAFAEGANDYLVKLPDAIELIARIRYHSKAYQNQIQRDEVYRADCSNLYNASAKPQPTKGSTRFMIHFAILISNCPIQLIARP